MESVGWFHIIEAYGTFLVGAVSGIVTMAHDGGLVGEWNAASVLV